MADQLESIQTHLWVITVLIGLFLGSAVLCNYMRISEGRDLKKMRKLADAEKYSDLLALTNKKLRDQPGEGNARIYKAIALYGLDRLDEARSIAEELKAKSPLYYPEASALLKAFDAAQAKA